VRGGRPSGAPIGRRWSPNSKKAISKSEGAGARPCLHLAAPVVVYTPENILLWWWWVEEKSGTARPDMERRRGRRRRGSTVLAVAVVRVGGRAPGFPVPARPVWLRLCCPPAIDAGIRSARVSITP
jgi:hypothetical protein